MSSENFSGDNFYLKHYVKEVKKISYSIAIYDKTNKLINVYFNAIELCRDWDISMPVLYKALEGKSIKLKNYLFKKVTIDEGKSLQIQKIG